MPVVEQGRFHDPEKGTLRSEFGSGSASTAPGGSYSRGASCWGAGNALVNTANGTIGMLPAGSRIDRGASGADYLGSNCVSAAGGSIGVAAGACAGASCLAGEECLGGAGMMTFVGDGVGDWVTETTYRYVGDNRGNIMFVAPKRKIYCGAVLCLALLTLAALALLALLPKGMPTTTQMKALPEMVAAVQEPPKSCIFWGDPHVVTFDGGRPSFYGEGDYWVVKNDEVHIQGRYMGTPYTFGLAATQKVAISGSFINNHAIEIQPTEGGSILVDSLPVCEELGCTHKIEDLVTIVHDDQGDLIDEATSQFDRSIVHLYLPKGITMTVFRWSNYMDFKIVMKPLEGGQDGSCGNYNGKAEDDTTQAIFERIGPRVLDQDRLFASAAHVAFSTEEADMLNQCSHDSLSIAKAVCGKVLMDDKVDKDTSIAQLRACMFDECFGMNEHVLRSARNFASDQDLIAAKLLKALA